MLSLEKCKELLGEIELSDEQILKLRDDMYQLATIALDNYYSDKDEV